MPTYPTTIDATQTVHLIPFRSKPVYVLGGIYQAVMYYSGGNYYVRMLKSLDAGDTWSELDSGNRPQISKVANYISVGSFQNSTDMWFAYPSPTGTPPTSARVKNFNYATGTWGTEITGAPVPLPVGAPTVSFFVQAQLGIAVRENGDIVLVYTGTTTTLGGDNFHSLRAAVYSGSSWSSPIDVMYASNGFTPGIEGSYDLNYELTGVQLGANDVVHVMASTDKGYAYRTILPDNSVANYRRFGDDNRQNHFGTGPLGGAFWGQPIMATLCDYAFFAVPIGVWKGPTPADTWEPGLLLRPDTAAPVSRSFQTVDTSFRHDGNWSSVAIAQDSTTKSLYLIWNAAVYGVGDGLITMSCWNGLEWSAPSQLFTTDYSTYNLIEEIEFSVVAGVLRMTFASPYGMWFWQGDVTCSATGCSTAASVGNINAAR